MFPVNVCLPIEPQRFVEKETWRKRLDSLYDDWRAGLAIFQRRREFEMVARDRRSVVVRLLRWIPRLRFAPLGMRQVI